jgi:flagellar basal-body rod protein FlgB
LGCRVQEKRREVNAMAGMTGMVDALSRYLDLTADSMKLTAGNMANIDTPGYKTQGFDFEREFAAALQTSGSAVYAGPKAGEVDGLVARPDGNTVSMDRESLEMAKAQLKFRLGTQLLKHEFAGMLSAIHADTK